MCDVYLSMRSSLSCRPCGSVTSSRPEETPICPFSSGVTPSILATWRDTIRLSLSCTRILLSLSTYCMCVRERDKVF